MKKTFIGKEYFNTGTKFVVLGETEKAIILQITRNKQHAFQVIDHCAEYPKTTKELDALNVFRTTSKRMAEKNFADRNQLKIEQ